MKTLLLYIALLTTAITAFAQTDCRPYVPTEEGSTWEITNYNARGKVEGRIVYTLLEKETNGDQITFKVENTYYDKKDKEIFTNTFEAQCIDGEFILDMTYKMDGASMGAYENMDVTIDASEFELPDFDAAPGTQLEDATMKVTIGDLGINMQVLIDNRLVTAQENITTPAGSFDCVVLSQDTSTKLLLNVRASSKEWYAENIGMVRSESYNKRGKMTGYSELTKFEE